MPLEQRWFDATRVLGPGDWPARAGEILAEALALFDDPAREIVRLRAAGHAWDEIGRRTGMDARAKLHRSIDEVSRAIARRRRREGRGRA